MQVSSVTTILTKQNSTGPLGVQSSASSVSDKQGEKLTEAKNAIGVLKQARASKSDSQKNAARQKLELLRQQLQKMQMLGATPKQIAQMARELAQAVKDYAAAGDTPSEVQSEQADAGAGTNADVAATTGRDETAKDLSAGSLPPKAATESTGPSPIVSTSQVAGSDADNTKAEDGRQTLAQYEKTLSSYAGSNHSATAPGDEDDERIFYSAARLLAEQLKGAAQQAAKRTLNARDLIDATKVVDDAAGAVDTAEALAHSTGLSFSV